MLRAPCAAGLAGAASRRAPPQRPRHGSLYTCGGRSALIGASPPEPAWVEGRAARDGTGCGATEHRRVLYHRYQINADGTVAAAAVVHHIKQHVISPSMRAFIDRLDCTRPHLGIRAGHS